MPACSASFLLAIEAASIVDGVVPAVPKLKPKGRNSSIVELTLVASGDTNGLAVVSFVTLFLTLAKGIIVVDLDEIAACVAEKASLGTGELRAGRTAGGSGSGGGCESL
jgi:hypothetical protein